VKTDWTLAKLQLFSLNLSMAEEVKTNYPANLVGSVQNVTMAYNNPNIFRPKSSLVLLQFMLYITT